MSVIKHADVEFLASVCSLKDQSFCLFFKHLMHLPQGTMLVNSPLIPRYAFLSVSGEIHIYSLNPPRAKRYEFRRLCLRF